MEKSGRQYEDWSQCVISKVNCFPLEGLAKVIVFFFEDFDGNFWYRWLICIRDRFAFVKDVVFSLLGLPSFSIIAVYENCRQFYVLGSYGKDDGSAKGRKNLPIVSCWRRKVRKAIFENKDVMSHKSPKLSVLAQKNK